MRTQERFILSFLKTESASGILLMIATGLALIWANTPLDKYYALFLNLPVAVQVGSFQLAKPLLLWINDGLMVLFFFLVGLEVKREIVEGELSRRRQIVLPGAGAIGGMIVPALIYVLINRGDPVALRGWAIPVATDIAFALGVLSLLGGRIPTSAKVFLTTLAIFDDIGAVLIIALFYTKTISINALVVVAASLLVLAVLNRQGVEAKSTYLLVGLIMWVAMLRSGIHATLTGILVAMFVPSQSRVTGQVSPLKSLERDLHVIVAYFVLPFFAFANAGIPLRTMTLENVLHTVPLGIALGLFVGKQVGIMLASWFVIRARWAVLPNGMTWQMLYGTAALCGIGFTMSLFIGSLAFKELGVERLFDERLGIIMGSLISGVVGYGVLRSSSKSAT